MREPSVWGGWWIVFTLAAAVLQTFRNAMQSSLASRLGTLGATHVRFLFGLPFACLFLLVAAVVMNGPWPAPTVGFILWVVIGALSQIGGTALMLAAMRERSFVVATAYIKTEPIQVALFGLVFLGDRLTPLASAAVMIATGGVVAMAWPRPAAAGGQDGPTAQAPGGRLRPALYGVASGALLALASVGFRGAILALGEGSFVLHATITLATNLLLQTLVLSGWLLLRDPTVLRAVIAAWRPSVPAGFAGAAASQMWFLAFALEAAARVRTLALVEILFAQLLSRRVFAESTSGRERAGIGLVMLGVLLLLMAG